MKSQVRFEGNHFATILILVAILLCTFGLEQGMAQLKDPRIELLNQWEKGHPFFHAKLKVVNHLSQSDLFVFNKDNKREWILTTEDKEYGYFKVYFFSRGEDVLAYFPRTGRVISAGKISDPMFQASVGPFSQKLGILNTVSTDSVLQERNGNYTAFFNLDVGKVIANKIRNFVSPGWEYRPYLTASISYVYDSTGRLYSILENEGGYLFTTNIDYVSSDEKSVLSEVPKLPDDAYISKNLEKKTSLEIVLAEEKEIFSKEN